MEMTFGSSSFITGATGEPTQHLEYLLFGELFIEERTTWNTPYKFSGKELDEETGYNYFGARYYDPSISIWLSVDPLSDKYPGLSPYIYTANNPIMFIDPDGKRIWITHVNKRGKEKRVEYKPGMRTFGRNKYTRNAIKSLNYIRQGANYDGGNKVDDLVASEINLTISKTNSLGSETFQPSIASPSIEWNDRKVDDYGDGNKQSAVVGLAHELEHGWKFIGLIEKAYQSNSDDDWHNVKEFQEFGNPLQDLSPGRLNEEQRAMDGLESRTASRLEQHVRSKYDYPLRSYESKNPFKTVEE